jgi:hypothetical protein
MKSGNVRAVFGDRISDFKAKILLTEKGQEDSKGEEKQL